MTAPVPLRVTPAGLRAAAQRCSALAATVAPVLPRVAAAAWQSTGSATSTVNAGVSKTAASLRGRMTASANKLTKAAGDYENQDHHGAADLTAAGSNIPAGSGADGGAGGMTGAQRPGPIPTGSGGDGGAGGLGIPR